MICTEPLMHFVTKSNHCLHFNPKKLQRENKEEKNYTVCPQADTGKGLDVEDGQHFLEHPEKVLSPVFTQAQARELIEHCQLSKILEKNPFCLFPAILEFIML